MKLWYDPINPPPQGWHQESDTHTVEKLIESGIVTHLDFLISTKQEEYDTDDTRNVLPWFTAILTEPDDERDERFIGPKVSFHGDAPIEEVKELQEELDEYNELNLRRRAKFVEHFDKAGIPCVSYHAEKDTDLNKLLCTVNRLLEQGWELFGCIQIARCSDANRDPSTVYLQTLVKY